MTKDNQLINQSQFYLHFQDPIQGIDFYKVFLFMDDVSTPVMHRLPDFFVMSLTAAVKLLSAKTIIHNVFSVFHKLMIYCFDCLEKLSVALWQESSILASIQSKEMQSLFL